MEVAQAGPGRSHWSSTWPLMVLALLFIAAFLAVGGQALVWAAGAAIAAPMALPALALLLLLPGLALLRLFWPDPLDPVERWTLALGVGCALPPLLLLVSASFGARWGAWSCWGVLVVSALVVIWPRAGISWRAAWGRVVKGRLAPAHLLVLTMTGVALLVQLYVVRELPVGMWGDSYHHTLIAQLLVEHGGLFRSWQPYAPLTTFTYHYGFHSLVAWLHWIGGVPTPNGLLMVGQAQIALAAPLVYLFTRRLLGSETAALWAALLAGFVSLMPAFYVNWGRYTQLGGQTALLAALVVWMTLLDVATGPAPTRARLARLLALTVIVTAGLALIHYRVGVFAACFVLAYALYLLAARVRSLVALGWLAGVGLAAGALTLLAVLPWLLRLREGALLQIGRHFVSRNIGAEQTNAVMPLADIFTLYLPVALVALALLGLALLLWGRNWRGLVLPGWAALVWLAANPYLIGLTGAGIVTSFAVLIAGYLLLAPLAGAGLAGLAGLAARLPAVAPLMGRVQLAGGALALLWGVSGQQQIVNPAFQLFTPADAAAVAWLRANTPPDARIFVNSFPAYSGTLFAGSDGGWWLPFLSGRQTNLPPITYGSEAADPPDYRALVNADNAAMNAMIAQYTLDSDEVVAALRTAGYAYLYDGPAANPPVELINPAVLADSARYELVYSHDGVSIWRVP